MARPKGSKNKATLAKERKIEQDITSILLDERRNWGDINEHLDLVSKLASQGANISDIARLFNINRSTMYSNKAINKAFEHGKGIGNLRMQTEAYNRAMAGTDDTLLRYFNKMQQEDWTEEKEGGDSFGITIVHPEKEDEDGTAD